MHCGSLAENIYLSALYVYSFLIFFVIWNIVHKKIVVLKSDFNLLLWAGLMKKNWDLKQLFAYQMRQVFITRNKF